MRKRSSRIIIEGDEHNEIFIAGKYHDKAIVCWPDGTVETVWEKLNLTCLNLSDAYFYDGDKIVVVARIESENSGNLTYGSAAIVEISGDTINLLKKLDDSMETYPEYAQHLCRSAGRYSYRFENYTHFAIGYVTLNGDIMIIHNMGQNGYIDYGRAITSEQFIELFGNAPWVGIESNGRGATAVTWEGSRKYNVVNNREREHVAGTYIVPGVYVPTSQRKNKIGYFRSHAYGMNIDGNYYMSKPAGVNNEYRERIDYVDFSAYDIMGNIAAAEFDISGNNPMFIVKSNSLRKTKIFRTNDGVPYDIAELDDTDEYSYKFSGFTGYGANVQEHPLYNKKMVVDGTIYMFGYAVSSANHYLAIFAYTGFGFAPVNIMTDCPQKRFEHRNCCLAKTRNHCFFAFDKFNSNNVFDKHLLYAGSSFDDLLLQNINFNVRTEAEKANLQYKLKFATETDDNIILFCQTNNKKYWIKIYLDNSYSVTDIQYTPF